MYSYSQCLLQWRSAERNPTRRVQSEGAQLKQMHDIYPKSYNVIVCDTLHFELVAERVVP